MLGNLSSSRSASQAGLIQGAATPGVNVSHATAEVHIRNIIPPLTLIFETKSGARGGTSLENLNDADQALVRVLLAKLSPLSRQVNLNVVMNPENGKPSDDAKELKKLIEKALGRSLTLDRGEKVFVTEGSFLENYKVDNEFRNRAIEKEFGPNDHSVGKIGTLLQHNCANGLLECTKKYIEKRKSEIDLELDQVAEGVIKQRLKRKQHQFQHLPRVNETVVLTATAFNPLDLRNNPNAAALLNQRAEAVKSTLDEQVTHGWFDWIGNSAGRYEPRSERASWHPMIPIGCSETSIHDEARKKYAADIARETATCDEETIYKAPTAESFFIEIAKMAASGLDDDALRDAIGDKFQLPKDKSYLPNAFKTLDDEDPLDQEELSELRDQLFKKAQELRDISITLHTEIPKAVEADPNMTNDRLRGKVDSGFTLRLNTHP